VAGLVRDRTRWKGSDVVVYNIVLHALIEWQVTVKVVSPGKETMGLLRQAGPAHFSLHDQTRAGRCLGILEGVQGITVNAGEYITVTVARLGPGDAWNRDAAEGE
jgi:hypothetical protein